MSRSIESRPSRLVPLGSRRGAKRPESARTSPTRARAASVWSPDEELAAAVALADTRVRLWRCLLADPQRVEAVRAWDGLSADEALRTELERLVVGPRRAARAAIETLAPRMADADRDLVLAARLVPSRSDGAAAAWDDLQAQRRAFAAANLRLVSAMTRRFVGRGMDSDDLVQEGSMGLLRAVDRYDHRLGFRFSTYAVWWVRHAMERAIRNRVSLVRIPVPTQDALHRLGRARADMLRREGRAPTERELSDSGFSAATVRRLDRATVLSTVVPLHAEGSDESGPRPRMPALVDEHENAEQHLGQRELAELATAMLDRLRPREAEVLRRRFGLEGDPEETLAEIGTRLSMSRERVRQIQNDALQRIRTLMQRRDPGLALPGVVAPRHRLAS